MSVSYEIAFCTILRVQIRSATAVWGSQSPLAPRPLSASGGGPTACGQSSQSAGTNSRAPRPLSLPPCLLYRGFLPVYAFRLHAPSAGPPHHPPSINPAHMAPPKCPSNAILARGWANDDGLNPPHTLTCIKHVQGATARSSGAMQHGVPRCSVQCLHCVPALLACCPASGMSFPASGYAAVWALPPSPPTLPN
jgi:hypothetical protein